MNTILLGALRFLKMEENLALQVASLQKIIQEKDAQLSILTKERDEALAKDDIVQLTPRKDKRTVFLADDVRHLGEDSIFEFAMSFANIFLELFGYPFTYNFRHSTEDLPPTSVKGASYVYLVQASCKNAEVEFYVGESSNFYTRMGKHGKPLYTAFEVYKKERKKEIERVLLITLNLKGFPLMNRNKKVLQRNETLPTLNKSMRYADVVDIVKKAAGCCGFDEKACFINHTTEIITFDEVQSNDIILCAKNMHQINPGVAAYNIIIRQHKAEFWACTSTDQRGRIIDAVLKKVYSANPVPRFLTYDEQENSYVVLPSSHHRTRVQQSLTASRETNLTANCRDSTPICPDEVAITDVICYGQGGDGQGWNSHMGTCRFQNIINERKDAYHNTADDNKRKSIVQQVIAAVNNITPKPRFLQYDDKKGVYYNILESCSEAEYIEHKVYRTLRCSSMSLCRSQNMQQFGVGENDVIAVRGTILHTGNIRYQDIVADCACEYKMASTERRREITHSVITRVQNVEPKGRFLEFNQDGTKVIELTKTKIWDKVKRALSKVAKVIPASDLNSPHDIYGLGENDVIAFHDRRSHTGNTRFKGIVARCAREYRTASTERKSEIIGGAIELVQNAEPKACFLALEEEKVFELSPQQIRTKVAQALGKFKEETFVADSNSTQDHLGVNDTDADSNSTQDDYEPSQKQARATNSMVERKQPDKEGSSNNNKEMVKFVTDSNSTQDDCGVGENDVIAFPDCRPHTGNVRYQGIVARFARKYRTVSKDRKSEIISEVIELVQNAEPKARFLALDGTKVIELNPKKIRQKVSLALGKKRPNTFVTDSNFTQDDFGVGENDVITFPDRRPHTGNMRFQGIVERCTCEYRTASMEKKKAMIGEVIELVQNAEPKGRFLAFNEDGTMVIELSQENTRAKVATTANALGRKRQKTVVTDSNSNTQDDYEPPRKQARATNSMVGVGENDVITFPDCRLHIGNTRFQGIVANFRCEYRTASMERTREMIGEVIELVQNAEPKGRFLEFKEDGTKVIELSPKKIRHKVTNALGRKRPNTFVIDPNSTQDDFGVGENDVITFPDRRPHTGNIRFQGIVAEFRCKYRTASMERTREMIGEVIELVQNAEPKGRFLEFKEDGTKVIELSPKKIRHKVSNALGWKSQKTVVTDSNSTQDDHEPPRTRARAKRGVKRVALDKDRIAGWAYAGDAPSDDELSWKDDTELDDDVTSNGSLSPCQLSTHSFLEGQMASCRQTNKSLSDFSVENVESV